MFISFGQYIALIILTIVMIGLIIFLTITGGKKQKGGTASKKAEQPTPTNHRYVHLQDQNPNGYATQDDYYTPHQDAYYTDPERADYPEQSATDTQSDWNQYNQSNTYDPYNQANQYYSDQYDYEDQQEIPVDSAQEGYHNDTSPYYEDTPYSNEPYYPDRLPDSYYRREENEQPPEADGK